MWIFVDACISFPRASLRPPAVCVWSHDIGPGIGQVEGSSVLDGTAQFVNGPKFLWCLKHTPAVLDRAESKSEREKDSAKKNIPKISHHISQTFLNQFWDLAENVLSLRLMIFQRVKGDSCRPRDQYLEPISFLQMYSLHNKNIQVFQTSDLINQIWSVVYSWLGSQECRSLSQILQNIWIMEAWTNP